MEFVISNLVPLSYNSRNKAVYQNKIRSALNRKYKGKVPMFPQGQELYGRIFFFTSDEIYVDCDNISKPIWDAINQILYMDDSQVVMRTAAIIDVNLHPIKTIDTSLIDSDVAVNLLQELTEPDVRCLYIECDIFQDSMIKIGKTNI